MKKPNLRFPLNDIVMIADRYKYSVSETDLMHLIPEVLQRGYLTKDELQKVAYWKAPRSAGHAGKNDEVYVTEVTRFALSTESERARIQSLTLLDGVSWPTASVLLHLFHADPYPILDFRALWSLHLEVPAYYGFGFWWPYVEFCREVATTVGVDMRILDRAVWQYSKENQQAVQQTTAAVGLSRAAKL